MYHLSRKDAVWFALRIQQTPDGCIIVKAKLIKKYKKLSKCKGVNEITIRSFILNDCIDYYLI